MKPYASASTRTINKLVTTTASIALLFVASPIYAAPADPGLCSVGKQLDAISFDPAPVKAPECLASGHTRTTLQYGTDPVYHKVDVYQPNGGVAPYPTVVWIHGGAWRQGTRTAVKQVERLLCRGYAVASIDYRLAPQNIFPTQIHDVKAAIRFLKSSTIASQFSLDTNRFAVFGSSAGGHLSALAGTAHPELEDLSSGNADVSSRVNAVVAWYPPTDFDSMDAQAIEQGCINPRLHNTPESGESELLGCVVGDANCADEVTAASPLTYADKNDPVTLILHGTEDCTVPTQQGRLLHDKLYSDVGACSTFRTVEGADHGDRQNQPEFWASTLVQDRTADFLDVVLPKPRVRTPVTPSTANCSAFIVSGDAKSLNGALWTYSSTDGGVAYKLNGILMAPASVSNPIDADQDGKIDLPGIVVSHGRGGTVANYTRRVGKTMVTWGSVVIGVTSTHAANGDGNSTPGSSSNTDDYGASTANVLRARKTRDLLACVNLSYTVGGAAKTAEIDMDRVAAHGHSMGAYITGQLVGESSNDYIVASHSAGGTSADAENMQLTRAATVAQIRTPYQAHHGEDDGSLMNGELFADVLFDNGTPHRFYVYKAYQHNDVSSDPTVLSRVQSWYQTHGLLK